MPCEVCVCLPTYSLLSLSSSLLSLSIKNHSSPLFSLSTLFVSSISNDHTRKKMMTTKTHNYECCMCGDHGLSYELFRCKVCHFRSQHRYCSNLYPKAESYRVCNWCLIQKNDDHLDTLNTTTNTTPTSNNTNSPSSQDHNKSSTTPKKYNNHVVGEPRPGGVGPKSLHPLSPIKKPAVRSPDAKSPLARKRISGPAQDQERLRRTKSEEMSNNNSSSSSRSSGGGGPAVIKHVFRNKVRRYKLLEEVSS